jgi:tetratricopeptide (TPR) repeat protein
MNKAVTTKLPTSVRVLARIQLPIAILAIAVSIYVGIEIKPLLQQRQELKQDVQQLKQDIQQNEARLKNLREVIGLVGDGRTDSFNEQYDQALKAFNKALDLDPQNAYILNLKGYALFKLGNFKDALNTFQSAVTVDPNYAWSYVDLALTYCAIGNYDEASKNFTKATELDSNLNQQLRGNNEEFERICRPILVGQH